MLFVNQRRENREGKELKIVSENLGVAHAYSCGNWYEKVTVTVIHTDDRLRNGETLLVDEQLHGVPGCDCILGLAGKTGKL